MRCPSVLTIITHDGLKGYLVEAEVEEGGMKISISLSVYSYCITAPCGDYVQVRVSAILVEILKIKSSHNTC